MSQIVKSACQCGEAINIETGLTNTWRNDGKRLFYDNQDKTGTQLRCRKCRGWLADTCPGAEWEPNDISK